MPRRLAALILILVGSDHAHPAPIVGARYLTAPDAVKQVIELELALPPALQAFVPGDVFGVVSVALLRRRPLAALRP